MTKFKIAACVILYNPEADVVENVKSYAPFVDKLFVVNNQNGDEVISKLQNLFEYIEVITYPENMGIALPLNDVLAKAKGNFDFLLTMDQDSCFSDGSIPKYFSEIESFNWKETLGVSPAIITADAITPPCSASVLWKRTLRAITSGNLINVENALKIKGFNEKLFIDEVDHEFCYRGFKEELYTYKCIQGIFLIHKIGTPSEHSFLGRKVHPMNHSYIRKYYIVRNRLYVYKCFWDIAKYENFNCYIIGTLKLLVKMYLFEDDLWRKTKAIYAGVKDFILENYGKKKFRY